MVQAIDYHLAPRAQQPGSPNKLRLTSAGAALGWDAFHLAEKLLTQPLHVVFGGVPVAFGSCADGLELYRRARSADKTMQIVPSASHHDLCDQPEATDQALAQLVPFYKVIPKQTGPNLRGFGHEALSCLRW